MAKKDDKKKELCPGNISNGCKRPKIWCRSD